MRTNNLIRETAKTKGVLLWEIADRLGMPDSSFSRKLRRELNDEACNQVLAIIDEIAAEKQSEEASA